MFSNNNGGKRRNFEMICLNHVCRTIAHMADIGIPHPSFTCRGTSTIIHSSKHFSVREIQTFRMYIGVNLV